MIEVDELAKQCLEKCDKMGWSRNWSNGGCYLHLEVSELIEALRGKGNPTEEAGDVLFVFLSIISSHNISFDNIIKSLQTKC